MNTEPRKASHKFGANRKETTQRARKETSGFGASRDVREDRGERQSKFAHNERTLPAAGPDSARELKRKTAESMNTEAARHEGTGEPHSHGGNGEHLQIPEHASESSVQRIRLGYYSAEARSVSVAGQFNGWNPERTPMEQGSSGYWTVDLDLAPGNYEYRFFVDGAWADDPLAPAFVRNPFGSHNSILHVAPQAA